MRQLLAHESALVSVYQAEESFGTGMNYWNPG